MSPQVPPEDHAEQAGSLLVRVQIPAPSPSSGAGAEPVSPAVSPVQVLGPLLVGITELEQHLALTVADSAGGDRFALRPTVVSAGSMADIEHQPAAAVVHIFASTTPEMGHAGLVHVITRLAEQIADERGSSCAVEILVDKPPRADPPGDAPTDPPGDLTTEG